MIRFPLGLLGPFLGALVASCASSPKPAPQPAPYAPPPQGYAGYPQYGPAPAPYPPSGRYAQPAPYPQPPPPGPYAQPQPTYPSPAPAPASPAAPAPAQPPPAARPFLAPLIGAAAWQAEVRIVLAEQIANLSPQNQARVRGIPLVFDPSPFEVNAYAGCDERGAPFLAGTEGLLEAIDAIAQTRSTDDLYGTKTYEQYASTVIPRLAQSDKASAALPPGIIPMNLLADPARLSHAHEWFDDIVAFTFGHELGHHYLGHTGCANGQAMSSGPNPAMIGILVTNVLPGLNQPNEVAADGAGVINSLDSGRARRPAYRWSEAGALALLDFFARLERANGISALNPIGFLRAHPYPTFRMPIIQTVARTWYMQHPG